MQKEILFTIQNISVHDAHMVFLFGEGYEKGEWVYPGTGGNVIARVSMDIKKGFKLIAWEEIYSNYTRPLIFQFNDNRILKFQNREGQENTRLLQMWDPITVGKFEMKTIIPPASEYNFILYFK